MFSNAFLFHCPFCPEPQDEIFVVVDACLDQREESPDRVCLLDNGLDHPQEMLRFGCGTDRRTPCEHMVHVSGFVDRYGGTKELEQGRETPTWGFDFNWTAPALRHLVSGFEAEEPAEPGLIDSLVRALHPRVEVATTIEDFEWDALGDSVNHTCIYRVRAVIVMASDPSDLKAKVAKRQGKLDRLRKAKAK